MVVHTYSPVSVSWSSDSRNSVMDCVNRGLSRNSCDLKGKVQTSSNSSNPAFRLPQRTGAGSCPGDTQDVSTCARQPIPYQSPCKYSFVKCLTCSIYDCPR